MKKHPAVVNCGLFFRGTTVAVYPVICLFFPFLFSTWAVDGGQ